MQGSEADKPGRNLFQICYILFGTGMSGNPGFPNVPLVVFGIGPG